MMIASPRILAQETVIKGKAENSPGELVRLLTYADQFSRSLITLDSIRTDVAGNFQMNVDIPETSIAFLALGLKKGEFYIKPGSVYEFNIPFDTVKKRGSVFDEMPLQFNLNAEDDGLMEKIAAFNVEYNNFVLNNTSRIYRTKDRTFISDFAAAIKTEYKNEDSKYFNDYVHYTLAQLEWISKLKSEQEILETYFIGKPVLYDNIQYTEFFTELFKSRMGSTQVYSYDEVILAINEGGLVSLEELLLRSDLLAADQEVQELVAVLLLAKKYYNPDAEKDKVISLLAELNAKTTFAGIRNVSDNYIKKLQHLAFGSPAPPFELINQDGSLVSLDQFDGKFLILNFVRTDCIICLHYFQNLADIKKQFGSQVEIITICTKEGFNETYDYASARDFDWPFLNIANNFLLLENYEIRVFPTFVLINPDLTIAMATAPLPGEGLELYLKKHMSSYSKQLMQEGTDK